MKTKLRGCVCVGGGGQAENEEERREAGSKKGEKGGGRKRRKKRTRSRTQKLYFTRICGLGSVKNLTTSPC